MISTNKSDFFPVDSVKDLLCIISKIFVYHMCIINFFCLSHVHQQKFFVYHQKKFYAIITKLWYTPSECLFLTLLLQHLVGVFLFGHFFFDGCLLYIPTLFRPLHTVFTLFSQSLNHLLQCFVYLCLMLMLFVINYAFFVYFTRRLSFFYVWITTIFWMWHPGNGQSAYFWLPDTWRWVLVPPGLTPDK